MTAELDQAELERAVKHLSAAEQPPAVCAIVGHSCILFSYDEFHRCGRCRQILEMSDLSDCVIIDGCQCRYCREKYDQMDFRDKFLTPVPFDIANQAWQVTPVPSIPDEKESNAE